MHNTLTENSVMKTSEFSLRPFDQTQRFSISEFLVLEKGLFGKKNQGKPGKFREFSDHFYNLREFYSAKYL